VAALLLAGCRWCDAPLRNESTAVRRSSLAAHDAACLGDPRRSLRPASPPAVVGIRSGDASPGGVRRDRSFSPTSGLI